MDRMSRRPARGQEWLDQVFKSRAAETGGVIRRQIADVEREVGRAALISEVRRRNFRLIRTRAHFVIVCDPGPVQQIV